MANIYDMADTWNDGATTFTAIKMNVTDTASASGSLLMDLQVGGTSRLKVEKGGNNLPTLFVYSDNAGSPNIKFGNVFNFNITQFGSSLLIGDGIHSSSGIIGVKSGNINIHTSRALTWTNGSVYSGAIDLYLTRKDAANLRFGAADAAAPVAQTLSVQSVVAGTTNTNGADFTIEGSQGTGTGTGGSIIFKVAPAGSSGTAQNALVDMFSIAPTLYTFRFPVYGLAAVNYTIVGTQTIPFQVNGQPIVGLHFSSGSSGSWILNSASSLSWSSGSTPSNTTNDTFIYRDAANTLALRNGTNAQTFNIYNTYTDASNYERGFMRWNSDVLEIGTEHLGGTSHTISLLAGTSRRANLGIYYTDFFTGSGFRIYSANLSGGTDVACYVNAFGAGFAKKIDFVETTFGWSGGAPNGMAAGIAITNPGQLKITDGSTGTGELIFIVPTSDPGIPGALWNNGGTLAISQ